MTATVGTCWRRRKAHWVIATGELAARAEGMALAGRLDRAISLLSSASSQVKLGSLQQARYDARIDQLRQLQERFRPYQKNVRRPHV